MFVEPKRLEKIKQMEFDSTIPQHRAVRIEKFMKGPFADFIGDSGVGDPPANDSLKTYEELKFLSKLETDPEFVKEHDDIASSFKKVFDKYGEDFPEKFVEKVLKDVDGLILFYKYFWNRPRPAQLAKEYNVDLGDTKPLESMDTPSYPSGHSVQGTLLAELLADQVDENVRLKYDIREVGKNISYSRQVGRGHYPSDSKAGVKLGRKIYQYMRENP